MATRDMEFFESYAKNRFYSINKIKKLKIDYDEIDAFGFVTDKNLKNGYETIKELSKTNDNFEQHIMINNCAYIEEVNSILASFGVRVLIDELLEKSMNEKFKKHYSKLYRD